jgi:TolB-like protein
MTSCATLPQSNNSFESAIQESGNKINEVLNNNSILAVLNFTSSSEKFSNYVIEELMNYFVNANKHKIVDRQKIDTIIKEQNFQMSGYVSDESMQSVGQMLGAQYIITGVLIDMGNTYRFMIYALNVETAVREASLSITITSDKSIVYLLSNENTTSTLTPQNQKKYIFEPGFKEYKDYSLVSQTDQKNGFRITVLISTNLLSEPNSLLYNYGFKFRDESLGCNIANGGFDDIINTANSLEVELYNKGYNIGLLLTIIVDDGITATVYKYIEFTDEAFLEIVANRKPF